MRGTTKLVLGGAGALLLGALAGGGCTSTSRKTPTATETVPAVPTNTPVPSNTASSTVTATSSGSTATPTTCSCVATHTTSGSCGVPDHVLTFSTSTQSWTDSSTNVSVYFQFACTTGTTYYVSVCAAGSCAGCADPHILNSSCTEVAAPSYCGTDGSALWTATYTGTAFFRVHPGLCAMTSCYTFQYWASATPPTATQTRTATATFLPTATACSCSATHTASGSCGVPDHSLTFGPTPQFWTDSQASTINTYFSFACTTGLTYYVSTCVAGSGSCLGTATALFRDTSCTTVGPFPSFCGSDTQSTWPATYTGTAYFYVSTGFAGANCYTLAYWSQ